MLAAAIAFLALGSASVVFGILGGGPLSALAHFVGFVSLTLSAILLVLGLPATRNMVR